MASNGVSRSEGIDAWAASDELIEKLAEFHDDPLGFVMFAFPWNEEGGPLAPKPQHGRIGHNGGPVMEEQGPDTWQIEFLTELGEAVRARKADPTLGSIRMARVSGHGVGKTTLTAWIILWFMSCRSHPVVTVTANTAGQLSSTTWRELSKWRRMAINGSWFEWNATTLKHKSFPETWVATATPWSASNPEAFAGKHEENLLLLFDEASGIEDVIWDTAEGQMTTPGALWFAFGNGTKNTGRFYDLQGRFRHRWQVDAVDSRDAKQANQSQIQQWLDDYGEDSDFFRVRVRGQFPRASGSQLIGVDLIEAAQARFKRLYGDSLRKGIAAEGVGEIREYILGETPNTPLILSVDVARMGGDETVIAVRQGRTFFAVAKYRELTHTRLVGLVAQHIDLIKPDAVFLDAVGIGGPALDDLTAMGYEVEGVYAGAQALDPRRHYNKRAEMYVSTRDWLRNGGMIDPDDMELATDLREVQYGFAGKSQALQLETKEDMRARNVASPDTGDTLAYSFYLPVAMRRARVESVEQKLARWQRERGQPAGASWRSN